jgi:hypothetical protein
MNDRSKDSHDSGMAHGTGCTELIATDTRETLTSDMSEEIGSMYRRMRSIINLQ